MIMFKRILGGNILIATLFLVNLPVMRLQDCSTQILQTLCTGVNNVKSFLDPFPPNIRLDVRCDTSDHLIGWSLSPNGTEASAKMINTSLAKYTVSDNMLSINGVDASDEGIYRCIHRTGSVSHLCIYAYARAVFASCPSSYDGCSDPENISVTAGESIHFNASIVHTQGGNCGFTQTISNLMLKCCEGINCISGSTSLTTNARVSLSTERIFVLSNSTIEDSGVYQVIAIGTNPQNGGQDTSIAKIFTVTVMRAPPTTIATTERVETITDTPTNKLTTNSTSQSTTTVTAINETPLPDGSSTKLLIIGLVILAVTVTTLFLAIILTVVLVLKKSTHRRLKNPVETPKHPRDDHESGLDERDECLSERGSSTASLVNANKQEESARGIEPDSQCVHDSAQLQSTGQLVIKNHNTSKEEASDASSLISISSTAAGPEAHPVQNSQLQGGEPPEGVESASDTAMSENTTDVHNNGECEEGRKTLKATVKCTCNATGTTFKCTCSCTLTSGIKIDSSASDVNATMSDAADLINESEEDGKASESKFESGNAMQITGRVLPHGSNNSLADKTTNDTATGGDTTAKAQSNGENEDGLKLAIKCTCRASENAVNCTCSSILRSGIESDSPATGMTVTMNNIISNPVNKNEEHGKASESESKSGHAMRTNGKVLPHGSNNSLAGGEAPVISDDENDKAVQDDAYKDSPAYRNGNQDIKPEFQRMDYLPHQREHDTEPNTHWYPSEEQRVKREGLKKLDLNSKPAVKEFMNRVAPHILHKWMEIGIQLDVPRGHLEAFNQRHLGESMKILVEVFNYWENQSGDEPKTWYTIIDALKTPSVGEHTLASDLESTSNSTTSCDR